MSLLKALPSLSALLVVSVVVIGCSTSTINTQADYGQAAPRSTSDLTMPPGLTAPDSNSNYKMLNNQQINEGYSLNQIKDMQIVQGGSERWLVIKNKSVNQVWPMMQAYLNQQGMPIKYQNKSVGLIQTDWAARNTTVKETGARALFDWVGMGAQYSLDSKFMYRINLWQNESNTQVFVTNYQMDEVYPGCSKNLNQTIRVTTSDAQATKWMPVPPNPQMELGFLLQFMAFAGLSPDEVKQVIAAVAVAESAPAEARLQSTTLVIDDQFDRAWWRTGIALERAGLGVTDKNRTTGEYYVYQLQATVDNPDPGVFDRWFGSGDKNKLQLPKAQYTVKLQSISNQTNLTLELYPGATDKNFTANQDKYLKALQLQLK